MYSKLRIEGYINLPPWGIDVHRAYELMMTIDEIGNVDLIEKDGKIISKLVPQSIKELYEDKNITTVENATTKIKHKKQTWIGKKLNFFVGSEERSNFEKGSSPIRSCCKSSKKDF